MADEGKEFPDEFSPVPTPLTGSERVLVEKGTATIDDVKAFARTNLPAPSAASDAATKGYVDARPGAEEWSEHAAIQDVDLDGHKITGLGEPTDAADAATKGYVDAVSPTKIERSFAWGRSVAEVTDDGDIDLSIYRTGQTEPLRRVRVSRGSGTDDIILTNRAGMGANDWHSTLRLGSSPTPAFVFEMGPPGYSDSGGFRFSHGRLRLKEGTSPEIEVGTIAKQAYDRRADLEWWEPVWTPVANVDSVSNVECSYTRTYRAAGGSLVTLEGTIEVTPDAAGQCAVQVDLPIARDGSGLLAGTAMAMEVTPPGHVVAVASVAETTLTLGFIAEGADPYLVGFRISYRAA